MTYPFISAKDTNLTLTTNSNYYRKEVQSTKGELVVEYLDSCFNLLKEVVNNQRRTFVIFLSIQFPAHWSVEQRLSQDYFTKMINSLKAQMNAFDKRAVKNGNYRDNPLHFVRAVEVGVKNEGLHAHFVLMFNGHVFRNLGRPNSQVVQNAERDQNAYQVNMWWRIVKSWASALGFDNPDQAQGLVHFSNNYFIDQANPYLANRTLDETFFHMSYLCKAYSKNYALPIKAFSCSRLKRP